MSNSAGDLSKYGVGRGVKIISGCYFVGSSEDMLDDMVRHPGDYRWPFLVVGGKSMGVDKRLPL